MLGTGPGYPIFSSRGLTHSKLLSDISVNSFAKFDVGKSKHIIQCNNDGKIIAQGVCMRTAADEFHLQWTPAWWTDYKLRTGGYNAMGKFVNTTNYQGFHPTGTYTYSAPRPRGRTITGLDVLRTKYALGIYGKVFFIGRGRRCSHKILNTLFHRVREVTKALKSSFAFIQRGCVFRLINGFSYC